MKKREKEGKRKEREREKREKKGKKKEITSVIFRTLNPSGIL